MPEREGSGDRSLDALLGEIARSPEVDPAEGRVGQTLGRYRVDALLGRGGMGVVYRARDTKLARDVALKVLPPDMLADVERRARFLREARAAASITHPNTAAVYDVGEEGETVYLAMELVRGHTLRAILAEQPNGMPAGDVARAGAAIARGLAKAHEVGIVHRDLKPDNVMIGANDEVKILDFGLAKLRQVDDEPARPASTEVGRILGTPSYMSPEQAKGRPVDAKSDVFSLGVMLYEMASGRRPFLGATPVEIFIAIDRDTPSRLSVLRTDTPDALEAIVVRCLAKEPRDRPTAVAIAEALDAVRSVLEPSPRSTGWRRRAVVVSAIALAAVLAMFALDPRRAGVASDRSTGPASGSPKTMASGETTATLLASPESVLACPPLAAKGVDEPSGWLGAAAASLVCRRAVVLLGGQTERTLAPAELLGLPSAPSEGTPHDPFGEKGARERAVSAAKLRAAAYVDGLIAREGTRFQVELIVRDRTGRELNRGAADAPRFVEAVRRAMDGLALPRAAAIAPDVARWLGTKDIEVARLLTDWEIAVTYDEPFDLASLEKRKDEVAFAWPSIVEADARTRSLPPPNVQLPALDRSSPEAFARTATAQRVFPPGGETALADEIHRLLEKEITPHGQHALTLAEAHVRGRGGDQGGVRQLMVAAIQRQPRSADAWALMKLAAHRSSGARFTGIAASCWTPEDPDTWNFVAHSMAELDQRILFAKRARTLAPHEPLFSTFLVQFFLDARRREDARALASELLAKTELDLRLGGHAAMVLIEASEGRFGAARRWTRDLIQGMREFGRIEAGTAKGLLVGLTLEATMGRHDLADTFAEKFVLAPDHHIASGNFGPTLTAMACVRARPELARRCVARLRLLVDQGYFTEGLITITRPILVAAEAFAAAEYVRAAAALRPIATGVGGWVFAAEVFERGGEPELMERMDASDLASPGFNGATPAHMRAARLALARGDRARARELAQNVVDAWSTSDEPVPAVKEMQGLVTKLDAAGR